MNEMTWKQMDALDTLTYEMKALLEVVTDGLNNDVCPSNTEDSSNVIRQAIEKLVKVKEIHEQMWKQQREARTDVRTDEDADGEEDNDSENLLPGELWEDEEDNAKPTSSFDIKEIERHEDGSATYQICGSKEEMSQLFEVFFTSALIAGIKHAEGGNKKEVAKVEALEIARELVSFLRTWETSDDFDYDPVVKAKREELSQALKEAGV